MDNEECGEYIGPYRRCAMDHFRILKIGASEGQKSILYHIWDMGKTEHGGICLSIGQVKELFEKYKVIVDEELAKIK
jgi:hypothetical protein